MGCSLQISGSGFALKKILNNQGRKRKRKDLEQEKKATKIRRYEGHEEEEDSGITR